MFSVKVPATTANLGPGFDSLGMALSIYNEIIFEESDKPLEIIIDNNYGKIPTDDRNLIYSTMKKFYNHIGISELPNLKITQTDNIPLTRGLGSSAACIVGGLVAANELSGANLSTDEIAFLAAKLEGHPDNSTPALVGGFIVGVLSETKLDYIKLEVKNLEQLKFSVMIPDFFVSTENARNILPTEYSRKDAVFNISRAGLLVAALTTGKFEMLQTAMDDKIHQIYRSKIINNMDNIFKKAREFGAYSVYLSGAGPTLIAVTKDDSFNKEMKSFLDTLEGNWKIHDIRPDLQGAQVKRF